MSIDNTDAVHADTGVQAEDADQAQAPEAATEAAWPTAPAYVFSAPRRVATYDAAGPSSRMGAGTRSRSFFRSARWAADTTSVLTTAEDRVLRILQTEYPDADSGDDKDNGQKAKFTTPREFPQPDAIVSTAWYPAASVLAPETYCLVVGVRDTPVRLLDASDGRLRASYPIVDHQERLVGPHSLAFNATSTKLYCGFESAIEVFDITSPGTGTRLKTAATRRERGAQRGPISALAFSAHAVGTFAAGSYAARGSVSLYDEDTRGAVAHLGGVVGGGVTQVAFHPLDPNVVFVGSRRSAALQAFDLRDTSVPVAEMPREAGTNQRIAFDCDPWGRWIASGDEHGVVRVWEIGSGNYELVMDQQLADDAVSGVQFHAYRPILLTVAGSRNATDESAWDSDESSSDSGSDSDSDSHSSRPQLARIPPAISGAKDARLSLWSMT